MAVAYRTVARVFGVVSPDGVGGFDCGGELLQGSLGRHGFVVVFEGSAVEGDLVL